MIREPKIVQQIDTCESDRKFLADYIKNVDRLAGLVIEMFGENRVTLLSQTFRDMIREHAEALKEQHGRIRNHLCADNPLEPFSDK